LAQIPLHFGQPWREMYRIVDAKTMKTQNLTLASGLLVCSLPKECRPTMASHHLRQELATPASKHEE